MWIVTSWVMPFGIVAYPSHVPVTPLASAQTATMPPLLPVVVRGRSTRSTFPDEPAACEPSRVTVGDAAADGRCTVDVVVDEDWELLQADKRIPALNSATPAQRRPVPEHGRTDVVRIGRMLPGSVLVQTRPGHLVPRQAPRSPSGCCAVR